jgi:hypothetical protein
MVDRGGLSYSVCVFERNGCVTAAVLVAIVRPSSGDPASDSQVVLLSSAVPALLGRFVTAANSRALPNVPHSHVA